MRVHCIDNSTNHYLVEFTDITLVAELKIVAIVVNEHIHELYGLQIRLFAGSHKTKSSLELANHFLPRLYLLRLDVIFTLKRALVLKHKDTFAEARYAIKDL